MASVEETYLDLGVVHSDNCNICEEVDSGK